MDVTQADEVFVDSVRELLSAGLDALADADMQRDEAVPTDQDGGVFFEVRGGRTRGLGGSSSRRMCCPPLERLRRTSSEQPETRGGGSCSPGDLTPV